MGFLDKLFGIDDAKNAISNAANQNRVESNAAWQDAQGIQQPFLTQGQQSYGLLNNFLGVNGQGAQQQAYDGYLAGPDVQARLKSGINAIDNSYAARSGGVPTGGLLKAITRYGVDTATQDLNSYLGRLAASGTMGQSAANSLTGARYNSAGLTTGANTAEGNGLANASLAGGSILGNLISGAFGLAGSSGWNPFGSSGGNSLNGTMRSSDPWNGLR
jgi:hypothetical protein